MIMFTRIDKGLKLEAEKHVLDNQIYVSLNIDLEIAKKELVRIYEQKKL